MKKIYETMFNTVSLSIVVTVFVVILSVLGPRMTASTAEVYIGVVPPEKRILQTRQRVQPLDKYGRPDHTKDYWEVDQRGNLIQKQAGTRFTNPNGQNYRIEGGTMKPIDHLGRIEHNKKGIKLNDR
tara:strand:+ start:640 stop:1020 length:381 start_codon:yes stop_codon:yes gene_type:complete